MYLLNIFWIVAGVSFPQLCLGQTDIPNTETLVVEPMATPKEKIRGQNKGKLREKEVEGTTAPNRFEANTATKSKYHQAGTPLEVDPD